VSSGRRLAVFAINILPPPSGGHLKMVAIGLSFSEIVATLRVVVMLDDTVSML
jgi:hypothetical protein